MFPLSSYEKNFFPAETQETKRLGCGKFGKDPTVETSFLPDRSLSLCACVCESLDMYSVFVGVGLLANT